MPQKTDPPTFDRTLTDGPLAAAIWKIAWPTMFINVAGGFQGIVDHVTVGHFAGYQANAGVGVGWQIFAFFIVFINSVYGGVSVLVARFAGADEPEKVDRTFTQAFLFSAVFSIGVFTPVGYVLAPTFLGWIKASAEVQAEALPYLRTLFLGNAGLVLFFLIASTLRAAGDARTPMRLTVLMTAINLVLTVVLVRGFGPIPSFGTRGAALSTVASGAVVAILVLVPLKRRRLVVRFAGSGLPHAATLREVFRFGLPMGLQSLALQFGSIVLMRYVGSLEASAKAQAAFSVAHSQVFVLINLISISLMTAAATVAGQSLGAGKPERVVRTPLTAFLVALAVNIPLALLFAFAPRTVLGLFGLQDPQVLRLGAELLRYLSVASVFLTAAYIYIGALQGTGDTKSGLVITLISQVAVPLGLCALLDHTSGLTASGIWLAVAVGHFVRCGLAVYRFYQGRWQDIRIDVV